MQKDSLPGRRGEIIFVLRTTGVSPPDRDKGRRALDPGKNARAFFRFFIFSESGH